MPHLSNYEWSIMMSLLIFSIFFNMSFSSYSFYFISLFKSNKMKPMSSKLKLW